MEQINQLKSNRRDLVHKKLIYDFLIFSKFYKIKMKGYLSMRVGY